MEELNEALKNEVSVLRENQMWLKKDNTFKTDQLDYYLKNCGTQNDQIYKLRSDLVNKESELKKMNEQIN